MEKRIMTKVLRIMIGILPFFLFTFLPLSAQNPLWAKKAAQAVFTLKTFTADGQLLASSNGFFINEQGEAIGSFVPFKGAYRAVVIDAQGKEWPVSCIIGVNDMYDVAKFQIDCKKPAALTVAQTTAATGSKVWLLPYSAKKAPVCQSGTISNAELFQDSYAYYTLQMTATDQNSSCPILNDMGEVVGLLQAAASGAADKAYAVSARFAADMQMNGISMNDINLRSVKIPKALSAKYEDALLALFIGSSFMDRQQYSDYIDRFIQQFPDKSDGYIYRARQAAGDGDFARADADMQQAVKVADMKDDAHYQFAQLIFQKELYQNDTPFAPWSLDRALEESKAAYAANPQPVYRQQQAQILFARQQYDEAYNIYMELTKSNLSTAEMYYAAAQCKLQQEDKRTAMALLDSACNLFTKPYVKTAAPYLRMRAQLSMDTRRYQQAINDMNEVVVLEPSNAELWAEKASYELRVNLIDQALASAQECLRLAPEGSDGYLMTGIALCQKGDKQQGMQNLNKAKELGNDQAQTFIDKYSK